jgi:hypothetical protein
MMAFLSVLELIPRIILHSWNLKKLVAMMGLCTMVVDLSVGQKT